MPRALIVLIGMLSSNQKDVSPFPILKKKCSVEFQTIKAVFGTCPCANSQDNLDQFTVSFSIEVEVHLPIFEEAVRIWSLCEFS